MRRYTCYACAIMPDHVHILIRKHRDKAEQMIENFPQESRDSLIAAKKRAVDHPVWGGPGWKVFQNSQRQIEMTKQIEMTNEYNSSEPHENRPAGTGMGLCENV